jgi:hypothetical protein
MQQEPKELPIEEPEDLPDPRPKAPEPDESEDVEPMGEPKA